MPPTVSIPAPVCKLESIGDNVSPAQPIRQKRKKQMSKRFQKGYVYAVGKQWYGRYRRDIPDQEQREYPSVVLGPRKEMSKLEARQKLLAIISKEGLNDKTYLETLAMTAKTFNDVADAWELKRLPQLRISTQRTAPGQIAKHLRPFFGHLVLDSIKTGMVNEWIGTLHLAPKTVHNQWKQFMIIMNWYSQQKDEPKRAWYPTLPTIPHVEQRWFTQPEMRRIIDAAHGQYKVFFRLAGATGLRFGELAGLHVEDIVDGVVYARRSIYRGMEVEVKTIKGYRGVCIDSDTIAMLKALLGGRTTGRIFQGQRGAPLDNHSIVGEMLKPICKRLGIVPGGCHAFRHGRNSHMDMNHVPEKFKTNQMGHSSLRVNNIYTHYSDEFVRDTVERLALSCTQVHTN
jgi:integrase